LKRELKDLKSLRRKR